MTTNHITPQTLAFNSDPLTMSSREIAELTGKEHDNVRRDIKNLAEGLSLSFEEKSEPSSGGRPSKVFLLQKRETLILVSGYSVEMRARIIDRWMELEQGLAQPRLVVDPSDPKVMLAVFDHLQKKVADQALLIASQSEKVQQLDRLATAAGSLCVTDAAKTLQVRPQELFSFLRSHNWIYRRAGTAHDVGYQARINSGDLEHKVTTVLRADGTEKVTEQVRVTSQGLVKLAQLVKSPVRAA